MTRLAFLLALAFAISGCCTGGERSCPCPEQAVVLAAPVAAPPVAAGPSTMPTPDSDQRREVELAAAQKAWTDEITAATTWLAGCFSEANKEADPVVRDREKASCKDRFTLRVNANDRSYLEAKAEIARPR